MTQFEEYKLYAFKTDDKYIEKLANRRFIRITPDYILLYSKDAPDFSNCVEIDEPNLFRLSQDDKLWLFDCNMTILSNQLKQNKDTIIKNLFSKLNDFEIQLEKEQQKLKEECVNAIK